MWCIVRAFFGSAREIQNLLIGTLPHTQPTLTTTKVLTTRNTKVPGAGASTLCGQGSGAEHRRILCERDLGVSILVELRHHRLHLIIGRCLTVPLLCETRLCLRHVDATRFVGVHLVEICLQLVDLVVLQTKLRSDLLRVSIDSGYQASIGSIRFVQISSTSTR